MRKRILGYIMWLMLAAALYFFENNTGTRIILISSLLLPLIPAVRRGLLFPDQDERLAPKPQMKNLPSFSFREEEEPGDVRHYTPGDPVNRIHWKLSAKKDDLLIRERGREPSGTDTRQAALLSGQAAGKRQQRCRWLWMTAGIFLLALVLLFLIPEARRGAQALLNRLFEASEQVNAYVYDRFPVDSGQTVVPAAALLSIMLLALLALTLVSGAAGPALSLMAGYAALQVYFGLPLPNGVNVPIFVLFALWTLARPWNKRKAGRILAAVAAVSLAVAFFLPGVDGATEDASERVRDWLSRTAWQITGSVRETEAEEAETRHTHTLSLKAGDREARPDREYRLALVEEEQISMPHWVNYVRILLLLLLTVALVILPFLPFAALNARRKKTEEIRKSFQSADVSEAVCAIFQHVIAWLEATGNGAGNLPYIQWPVHLPRDFPKSYPGQFAQCAAVFEEANYSFHPLPEERRQQALELLCATEQLLLSKSNWKQKLRFKYGKCLYV